MHTHLIRGCIVEKRVQSYSNNELVESNVLSSTSNMRGHSKRTIAIVARSIVLWFAISRLCRAQVLDLYPYSTHQQLKPGDEETSTVAMTTPFVFLGQSYGEISVSETSVVEGLYSYT